MSKFVICRSERFKIGWVAVDLAEKRTGKAVEVLGITLPQCRFAPVESCECTFFAGGLHGKAGCLEGDFSGQAVRRFVPEALGFGIAGIGSQVFDARAIRRIASAAAGGIAQNLAGAGGPRPL